MTAVALWAPLTVPDLDAAADFYGTRLGLTRVDAWTRPDGERGAVYAAGPTGRIEVVQPGRRPDPARPDPQPGTLPGAVPSGPARPDAARPEPRPGAVRPEPGPGADYPAVPVALEVAAWADVDALHRRLGGTAPVVFPRGHYGFTAVDPAGHPVLIWSEGPSA